MNHVGKDFDLKIGGERLGLLRRSALLCSERRQQQTFPLKLEVQPILLLLRTCMPSSETIPEPEAESDGNHGGG